MTESSEHELREDRVRFGVDVDGTVSGNDGADGHLAATLRYACRMGAQLGDLLQLGALERVNTLGRVQVMARVSGTLPDLAIQAELDVVGGRRPASAAGLSLSVQEAIDHALRRLTLDLGSDWTALVTDDGRLVGAMHDESLDRGAPEAVPEVGVRALAILGALDEPLRETGVRLDFIRASVLVVGIGEHALVTQADRFDALDVARTVAAAQGVLAGVDLRRADVATTSLRA